MARLLSPGLDSSSSPANRFRVSLIGLDSGAANSRHSLSPPPRLGGAVGPSSAVFPVGGHRCAAGASGNRTWPPGRVAEPPENHIGQSVSEPAGREPMPGLVPAVGPRDEPDDRLGYDSRG